DLVALRQAEPREEPNGRRVVAQCELLFVAQLSVEACFVGHADQRVLPRQHASRRALARAEDPCGGLIFERFALALCEEDDELLLTVAVDVAQRPCDDLRRAVFDDDVAGACSLTPFERWRNAVALSDRARPALRPREGARIGLHLAARRDVGSF